MNIENVKMLSEAVSVSGREKRITDIIAEKMSGFPFRTVRDPFGNLTVHIPGKNHERRIAVLTGVDDGGYIVTNIGDDGRIHVGSVGGIDIKESIGTKVKSEGGVTGKVCLFDSPDEEKEKDSDGNCIRDNGKANAEKEEKKYSATDVYIDIGASDGTSAEGLTCISDTFVAEPCVSVRDDVISVSCTVPVLCDIMTEVARELNPEYDTLMIFLAQNREGMRGVRPALWNADADTVIYLSCEDCEDAKVNTGDGVLLVACGGSIISDALMISEADSAMQGIPHRIVAMPAKERSVNMISSAGTGCRLIGISLPVEGKNKMCKSYSAGDAAACAETIKRLIEDGI